MAPRRATCGSATRSVSFPVWAFATDETPGSSVSVVFPSGYDVRLEAGDIPAPTVDDDGRTIFRSGSLDRPLDFFAYLVADRPGAYAETTVDTTVADEAVTVTVRSWPDDPPWAERVSAVLDAGLPALGTHIGLAWPHGDELVVEEAVARTTGGYAGLFDPTEAKVEIAYYADDFVVLHEAAHGWFNGSLLADRWANEAFASYYATEVATEQEIPIRDETITPELQAARIPLNGWGPVGTEDPTQEDYAYVAGLTLARAIAERAGDEGLRSVWADAAAGTLAYQPADGPAEIATGTPDWRGLLDLLEERTDATYDDLWRTWVARPTDLPLLDARAAARERFGEVTATTDGWRLPRPVRDAMRSWRFDDAATLLDAAAAALEGRAAVTAAAEDAGLIAPDTLRTAFEDDDGFEDALAEADAELVAIDRYADAAALRPAEMTPILVLGLWGQTPEVDLDAARDALARGDLDGSVASSSLAAAMWARRGRVGPGSGHQHRAAARRRPPRDRVDRLVPASSSTPPRPDGPPTHAPRPGADHRRDGLKRPGGCATLAARSSGTRARCHRPAHTRSPTDRWVCSAPGPPARSCPAIRPTSTSREPTRSSRRRGWTPS